MDQMKTFHLREGASESHSMLLNNENFTLELKLSLTFTVKIVETAFFLATL